MECSFCGFEGEEGDEWFKTYKGSFFPDYHRDEVTFCGFCSSTLSANSRMRESGAVVRDVAAMLNVVRKEFQWQSE